MSWTIERRGRVAVVTMATNPSTRRTSVATLVANQRGAQGTRVRAWETVRQHIILATTLCPSIAAPCPLASQQHAVDLPTHPLSAASSI
jgi:hypothetical protein